MDKERQRLTGIQKMEGRRKKDRERDDGEEEEEEDACFTPHPLHPGSRSDNCCWDATC